MAITKRQIGATVGDSYVEIGVYESQPYMTMTVNGAVFQMPFSGGYDTDSRDKDTITALKEVINAL